PDIHHLLFIPFDGHLHTPAEIPGDRTILQPFLEPALTVLEDVALPAVTLVSFLHIALELRLIFSQWEIKMFRFADSRSLAGNFAYGIDQFQGIEVGTAVLALIALRFRITAFRAGSLDVPVGQEHPGLFVVELLFFFFYENSRVIQRFEEDPRSLMMKG